MSEQEEKVIMESVISNIPGELKQKYREQEDNLDVFPEDQHSHEEIHDQRKCQTCFNYNMW